MSAAPAPPPTGRLARVKASPRQVRVLTALLLAAGLAGLAWTAATPRENGRLFEDERIFAAAASTLLRHGVLNFDPPSAAAPPPSANRELGYPALVALAWRLAGTEPPATPAEVAALTENPRAWRPVRALNLTLLGIAAAAAALGVRLLAGALGGALAFCLVAASPALRATVTQAMSENLAAAHLALAALCLAGLARRERWALPATILVVGCLPLSRAEGILLLPAALAIEAWRGADRPARARLRAGLLLLLGLSLPSALWLARNRVQTGHATLSDRGGLALAVRAEIDAEVVRVGALSAALAWTPLEAAQRASRRDWPAATWLDYRPSGPGNFYVRTFRRWYAERTRPGADPLAVDAEMGRAALGRFARAPGAHLRATAAVAVRGMFAEVSPAWTRPIDLAFALGLLLAAGTLAATWRALWRRDLPALAFLAPAWLLFGFHALATELLPRYAVQLLPLAWAALALALAGSGPADAERRPG